MQSDSSSFSCGSPSTPGSDAESGKLNSFSAKLEEIFGLDLRSLSLFRIGLAGVVLVDLIIRSTDLRIFYTDFGLLPRSALIEKFLDSNFISFHLMNGTAPFQTILFSVYRTQR